MTVRGAGTPAAPTLDPRTTIFLVVAVGVVALGPYGETFVLPGLALAVALAISLGAWRRAGMLTLIVGGAWGAARLLLPHTSPAVAAAVVVPLDYVARYGAAVGVAMYLFATTSPTRLHAALRAMRVPRTIAVPLVMMIRFVPVVLMESYAVWDALRLRGLVGLRAMTRHPLLAVERFTVPMIAASLRAGDDLSSAALLRGMGSTVTPVALQPPRLRWIDAAWVVGAAALFAVAWGCRG